MSDDATTCTTRLVARGAIAVAPATADTAVTQVVIDAHPPDDHGVSHDEPVISHGPVGAPDEASVTASTIGPGVTCAAPSVACIAWAVAMPAMDSADAIEWSPCIRHSVPLATSESWSSSALESTAVRR